LALLSGVLLVLAFPGFNLWPLAWVGLIPLLFALIRYQLSLKQALCCGEATGVVFFYGSCYWITYSIIHYGGIPPVLAYLLAIIPALALGAFFALFAAGVQVTIRRVGAMGLFYAPFLWVVTEWLRLKVTGIGWNALGYSQAFHPRLIQIAEYVGVYGVSFLLVLLCSMLTAVALFLERKNATHQWLDLRSLVTGLGLVVLVIGISVWMFERHVERPTSDNENSRLRILAVQPDIPIEVMVDPVAQANSFHQLIQQTERTLAANPGMDLVIWPESPLNISFHYSPEAGPSLVGLVQQHHVYLLLNVLGVGTLDEVHNSVSVLSPEGRQIGEYHKIRLLPFGEYVPLRGIIPFIDRIPALAGDFAPGTQYTVIDIGKARLGSLICFEAMFPDIARRLVIQGATVLVNVSNYGWFGPTPAAEQHLAHAIFRAVETRRHLLCVTNSGISAHITPAGALIGQTNLFERATRRWVMKSLQGRETFTFYVRYGDLFVLVCAIASAAFIVKRKT
jgi:apolipoprotein N-acyltransferase